MALLEVSEDLVSLVDLDKNLTGTFPCATRWLLVGMPMQRQIPEVPPNLCSGGSLIEIQVGVVVMRLKAE
eukprot:CAMPEP_0180665232 /NCGR_PEP_ID=MMETSP1037_2-20121125/61156_1 /TAXON_ID=632150 /ORGANISM="Azadinium spinosum, Strain 3D9" /LENGTH=69 /DNA_ID=CAMNT_0022693629 /DNA_START=63 /DNA_END=269 /DNA_ORIENTATION=-